MTYQQKLDEARALINQFNSQIPDQSKINSDQFFAKLAAAGGSSEGAIAQCAWEDLQEFGLPKLLARQVASVFRAKGKEEGTPVLKKSKVESMSVQELLTHYDPRTPASLVTERLNAILPGKRFVVFAGTGVDSAASAKLAAELLDGYPEREFYVVDDVPYKTYRVGERPDQSFDENPLYPGRILRPDGDCDQTNRSWSGVPLEIRQILFLAVSRTGEVKINSINDAHNIFDLAVDGDALKTVRRRFVKSAALLGELAVQGKAPNLKVFKKPVEKSNNPFGTHRVY